MFKKNILLVCSSLGGGGAERVAVNLAASFIDQGHSVRIFYWNEKQSVRYEVDPKVLLTKSPKNTLWSRLYRLRACLKSVKPDVVISFTDIPNVLVFLAKYSLRNNFIFVPTIHSDIAARDANTGLSFRGRIIRSLHALACRSARTTVVVSDGARNSLIRYLKLQPSRTVTIYNPVLGAISEQQLGVERRAELGSPLRIMAAGRLTEAKDYFTMLEAIRLLHKNHKVDFRLDIYGDGPLKDFLMQVVVKKGIDSVVRFMGHTSALKACFLHYDLFLMTSRWEGFGNVLVEALDENMSIIATDCPSGPREILSGGRYGKLVPVGDAKAIANAIQSFVANGCRYEQKMEELNSHLEKFRVDSVANIYMQFFPR